MSEPQYSDERLAWLAVRSDLKQLGATPGALKFLTRLVRLRSGRTSADVGQPDLGDELLTDKMKVYAIAVDELSRRLSREERVVLRSTGEVPAWFLPAVIEESKTIRFGW